MSGETGGTVSDRTEGRGRRAGRGAWGLLLLLALAFTAMPAQGQQARRKPTVCAECHQNIGASRDGALAHAKGKKDVTCLSCHHLGFSNERATIVARRDDACKSCHTQLNPTHRDVHKGAPACASCHRIHDEQQLPAPAAAAAVSQRCATCHTKPHALHAQVTKSAPVCTDCHSAHAAAPIKLASAATVSQKCASCHKDAHPSHGTGQAREKLAGACTSCHSVDGNTTVAAAELTSQCATCHKSMTPAHAGVNTTVVAAGGVRKGAPACVDCHTFGKDGPLPQSAASISDRCGVCHTDAMQKYRSGSHAKGLAASARNGDLPTCVTCHPAHQGHAVTREDVRVAATQRCIQCHSDERLAKKYGFAVTIGKSYLNDYHGATMEFRAKHPAGSGAPAVLACADCHGPHAVAKNDKIVLAAVCLRCHKEGDTKIAGAWLGHAPASLRNRPLVWLARFFYFILIPFELIGLALNIAFHLIDQRRKGARPLETHGMKRLRARLAGKKLPAVPTVIRFRPIERIEHFLSMTTFIMLVVTGLPQTRPEWAFARAIIDTFGGIAGTRLVHRIFGSLFVTLLLAHVTRAIIGSLTQKHLPVMIPRKKDFLDAVQTLKHFISGAPRPKSAKFDATEKFEYWGLLLGGTLMSVTGVALIFPEQFSQLVPGVLLATFRVMHGLEATFAVLVIAMWHSYGVILRPEVFPLDTSIFTGKMPVERLEEEHGEEYERLFPEHGEEDPNRVVAAEEEYALAGDD